MNNKEDAQKFCKLLIQNKKIRKIRKTYFDRVMQNLYPDECVRGYFHHTSTVTMRLTSDQQQLPRKTKNFVKKIYVTRY